MKYFFVVSPYAKSGSTFTLALINQHSYCGNHINHENLLVGHCLHGIGVLKTNTSKIFYLDRIRSNVKYIRNLLIDSIDLNTQARMCGQKYPFLNRPDVILDFIPEAKVIYIVRDPRDSFASYLSMKSARNEAPITVEQWTDTHFMNIVGSYNLDHRALFVSYEKLINNFEYESTRIQAHLELPIETIDPKTFGDSVFSMFSNQSTLKSTMTDSGIVHSRIGRYRSDLSMYEITYLTNSAMSIFNDI
jgi:hypothetical protein